MEKENPEDFDANRQWQEIIKCANSFEYFCENYFEIYSSSKDTPNHRIPFILRDYQKECIDFIQKNQYTSFIKPRQMGLSAVFDVFAHWKAIFGFQENSAIINLLSRFRGPVCAKFPTWFPGYVSKFQSGIDCHYPRSNSHVRYVSQRCLSQLIGYNFKWLFIDEADFNSNIDELFNTYDQRLNRINIVAYTSKSYGHWTNFKKPVPFLEHRLHYSQNPLYTTEFLEEAKKNLGLKAFRREVLCESSSPTKQTNKEDFSNKTTCIMAGLGL